jgi:hypothetical protein
MSAVGAGSTRFWRAICVNILLVFSFALSSCDPVPVPTPISTPGLIKVKISNAGIETAIARVIGTNQIDDLDQNDLAVYSCEDNQYISVWAPDHLIGIIDCDGSSVYSITLTALDGNDNLNYNWASASMCRNCHSDIQGRTEYLEWSKDGHSREFGDSYFWNMYMGTDINGNTVGPGFRLDHPNENGNCAYCHAPSAVRVLQQGTLLDSNLSAEGITCDVCHKVMDVLLGNNRRPFVDRPGILSFSFVRPHSDQPFYVGPLADFQTENPQIAATCSSVLNESEFCAACHYGKFFDTVVYNSYGEWLESPYWQKNIASGDRKVREENPNYRSCQDCHMLYPEKIGQTLPSERDACSKANLNFRNFNHTMMKYGLDDESSSPQEIPLLIKDAATIGMNAIIEEEKIKVQVTVTNTRAGHKFPTDSPLRHLILLVEARDQNNTLLAQMDGPVIPLWGAADFAGRAGVIYANILKEQQSNTVPTFAYWNLTEPAWQNSDTRLSPGIQVPSAYSFAAPSNGDAKITAKLIYRYAFFDLADQKGWNRPDILVTSSAWECERLTDPVDFDCKPKVE